MIKGILVEYIDSYGEKRSTNITKNIESNMRPRRVKMITPEIVETIERCRHKGRRTISADALSIELMIRPDKVTTVLKNLSESGTIGKKVLITKENVVAAPLTKTIYNI